VRISLCTSNTVTFLEFSKSLHSIRSKRSTIYKCYRNCRSTTIRTDQSDELIILLSATHCVCTRRRGVSSYVRIQFQNFQLTLFERMSSRCILETRLSFSDRLFRCDVVVFAKTIFSHENLHETRVHIRFGRLSCQFTVGKQWTGNGRSDVW